MFYHPRKPWRGGRYLHVGSDQASELLLTESSGHIVEAAFHDARVLAPYTRIVGSRLHDGVEHVAMPAVFLHNQAKCPLQIIPGGAGLKLKPPGRGVPHFSGDSVGKLYQQGTFILEIHVKSRPSNRGAGDELFDADRRETRALFQKALGRSKKLKSNFLAPCRAAHSCFPVRRCHRALHLSVVKPSRTFRDASTPSILPTVCQKHPTDHGVCHWVEPATRSRLQQRTDPSGHAAPVSARVLDDCRANGGREHYPTFYFCADRTASAFRVLFDAVHSSCSTV